MPRLRIGPRIPGGCPDCLAYQELERESAGLFLLRIVHDDTCPALASKRATQ